MKFGAVFAAAVCAAAALPKSATLDPLHVDARRLLDSSGRVVLLRGVVTITRNNDGKPMTMTPADYDRIRAWGFNVQQIRLDACRMGLLPPCTADPAYFAKLDSWVNMAEERGIYTIFKVTTYDVPGLDFRSQFKKGAWDKLWDVSSGWQDQFVAGWSRLWEHFQGRTAVVGYDILNECFQGSNTPGFVHNYLFPFYRRAHAALERIDRRHLFLFQPPLTSDDNLEPLGGANLLFVPHYYPAGQDPEEHYRHILSEGEQVGAAVLIGEYGLPNTPVGLPGGKTIPAATPERDQADALLFDMSVMGTIKTWYTSIGDWSLLTPEGAEHPRFQHFSRPFPQRTAGAPKLFTFDFRKRVWNFEWQPDASAKAPTMIFVAARRHFPAGFRIATAAGLELKSDPTTPTGLRATANPKHANANAYRYDAESELLTISAGKTAATQSIKITSP